MSASLFRLRLVLRHGSVPGSSRDRVELEILFEAAPLAGSVRESFLLKVDALVVKDRYKKHRGSKWNSRHAHMLSIVTTSS